MEQLGINPIFLLSQIVNFFVLAFLLIRFAYRPILSTLDERRDRIEKGLEDARQAEEARANAEAERQRILDEARIDAQAMIAEANERSESQASKIVANAQQRADEVLEEARAEAAAERERMLGEMRGQISALAVAAANRIVRVSLDERRQQELVDEFFSGLREGRVTITDQMEARQGERAVVTSAVPLSEADRQSYRSYLQAQMGRDMTVDFRTDPSILGGVVLRVGDRVIDNSVSGRLGALQQQLR